MARLQWLLLIGAGLRCSNAFISAPGGAPRIAQCARRRQASRPVSSRFPAAERKRQRVLKADAAEDDELAKDQALIARVAAEVLRDQGVSLDQLINPSKVINLERALVKLRADLRVAPDASAREALAAVVEKKERTLATEKRAVMQSWLKQLFVAQAVISVGAAGLMVYDAVPFFPNLDLSVRVLGFWLIWLFTLPSLRARKPTDAEKTALNYAFLATPLVNLAAPFVTKDPVTIYWMNLAVTAGSYAAGYSGFLAGGKEGSDYEGEGDEEDGDANTPEWLRFVFKALDFGSGRERGARK